MKNASVTLFAAAIGCAFVQLISAATAGTYKEEILHSFGSGTDGAEPYAGVINAKGTLYGTTFDGGEYGDGAVFSLDPDTGVETVLYSFVDTTAPEASVIDAKGTLYGTTAGVDSGAGTVFAVKLGTNSETTLHTFCSQSNCVDGAFPTAGLIDVNGTLYGTTFGGGASGITACNDSGCGTVFLIDRKTGNEQVLYSFCSQPNCADGQWPHASLIDVNGMLYGTTENGGTGTGCKSGCGTVFSVNPGTGAEKVLYSFCSQPSCTDGATPYGGLIDVRGMLYGATEYGGNNSRKGIIFMLDPNSGVETVLYSFCSQPNCADGAQPFANLIDVNGSLYGTTAGGGSARQGTVFSFDPTTGAEKVLYSFLGGTDGQWPNNLIDVEGTLYGTTVFGGGSTTCGGGCGTVFKLKKKR